MTLNEFIVKYYNDALNGTRIDGTIDLGEVKIYRAGKVVRIDISPKEVAQ